MVSRFESLSGSQLVLARRINMKNMDILQVLNTTFTGITMVLALVAIVAAYKVGLKQNEITANALGIQDFAEVFMMPQQVIGKDTEGKEKHLGWNLLVKNSSSYPIYIDKYIFNTRETIVGGSVVPTHSDSWYVVPIPADVKEFTVSVDFSDHRGNKYRTEGRGSLIGVGWSIHSVRRIEL